MRFVTLFIRCFFLKIGNGIIKTPSVEECMRAVDRGHYSKNNPYTDSPQGIGFAVTISAPHMVPKHSKS